MNVLVLGGGRFLGRAVLTAAGSRGDRVTAFNRGSSVMPDFVEAIIGDRLADLERLRGRRFDAVIDTCGYTPAAVSASASVLAPLVERYVFVSSVSVYPWPIAPGIREDADVDVIPPGAEPGDGESDSTYGARKALCERAAEAAMPGRVASIRAGMIAGPHDYLDRLTYWIERTAEGGRMIAPGAPDRPLQLIDVDDLAHFMLHAAETNAAGPINATSPEGSLSIGDLVAACAAVARDPAEPVWIDDAELHAVGVEEDADLPYWVDANENGIFRVDTSRARRLGLTTRPLAETVARTKTWIDSRTDTARNRGLDRTKEQRILARRN